MQKSVHVLLQHVLNEIEYLESLKPIDSGEQLKSDPTLSRAVVRSLEIIGEASSQLPESFRNAHPEVPWPRIVALRNRLIHGYMGVNYNIVVNVLNNDVGALRHQVEQLIAQLGQPDDG